MPQAADLREPFTPPLGPGSRALLRWVTCNNPFYVISAGFYLIGIWISFKARTGEIETWSLMCALAAYTLLLALTAFVLVRFVHDWEDLRTVLLLVVLMFLATSVTFDEVLIVSPGQGFACCIVGLLFTVLVSEGVLRGIRLVLPAWFRAPYYLILALFFLYPLALSLLAEKPHSEALLWGLFGFTSVGGLAFLTLLPAIRRGPLYLESNSSPWAWPLYPWVLFGLLGLAIPARAFLLCWSMHLLPVNENGRVIFGPYFVVPFALAASVLLLELGLVSCSRTVQWTALATPVVLTVVALIAHRDDPIYKEFLTLFMDRLGGSPLYLTVLAAAAFYAYAAMRCVAMATEALTIVLVALAFLRPDTIKNVELSQPDSLLSVPLLAAVGLQLFLAWRRSAAWRLLLIAGVVSCWLAKATWSGYFAARQVLPGIDQIALSIALFAVAVLISLAKSGLLARWVSTFARTRPVLDGLSDRKSNGSPEEVAERGST
jgi:hypothetical protein